MKPTYINNIPILHGEVSVVMSDSVTDSARHSAALAKGIRDSGVNAFVINCGMSDQRYREIANPIIDSSADVSSASNGNAAKPNGAGGTPALRNRIEIRSCVRGNLVGEGDAIVQIIHECRMGVVIINSWEWTSSSYKRKIDLLYYLRGLMEEFQVAVVVYSTSQTNPEIGKPDRGGIGKLAELAMHITHLREADKLKTTTKRPKPLVIRSLHDEQAMERNAQLIAEKLKDYGEGVDSPLSIPKVRRGEVDSREEELLTTKD